MPQDREAEDATQAQRPGPSCFLHIPESAGTSLQRALLDTFGMAEIARRRSSAAVYPPFTDFAGLADHVRSSIAFGDGTADADLRAAQVVSGHFMLDELLSVTGYERIATVLREPRARLLSLYAFWRSWTDTLISDWRGCPMWRYGWLPLAQALADPAIARQTDNMTCRMLLGSDPVSRRTGSSPMRTSRQSPPMPSCD